MRKHKQTQEEEVNAGDQVNAGEQRRFRGPRGGGGGAWGSQQNRRYFFFNEAVQIESRKQIEVVVWS